MNIVRILGILILLTVFFIPVSAIGEAVVSKAILPYEVHAVNVSASNITFSGWAILSETQHFVSSLDHTYELEFTSTQHTFRIAATNTNINLTELMRFSGAPICAPNIYFQHDDSCYYRYENVGYTVTVPLSQFEMWQRYTVYLVVHATSSNTHKKIPIYYPIARDIVQMVGQQEYRVISKLNDTKLTVKYSVVLARKTPEKTSEVWTGGTPCAVSSGNLLYFQLNSVYTSIKERYFNPTSQTTYYRVASNLATCIESRRRIVEGSTISPVWIASSFVEYTGTPLVVSTRIINTVPKFTVVHATIYSGVAFNWRNNVSVYDAEEGNISDRIEVISDNYHNTTIPGTYIINLMVQDSYGEMATAFLGITVLESLNTAPIIYAYDFELLLNTPINYRDYVSAFDQEDGDLTYKVIVTTSANLRVVGTYPVCYDVTDSQGAKVSKCVNLKVFDYATLMARFRFVDKDKLFYKESVPTNWNGYIQRLTNLLETSEILDSSQVIQ